MLKQSQVQRYAHESGLRDLMIAEREVVLTFVLQLLAEKGVLAKLAFKGGTCIRKMFLGTPGRFSTDLDFTSLTEEQPDDLILELLQAFEQPYHGIQFEIPDKGWYTTSGGLSWAVNPVYRHEWNTGGDSQFEFQVSHRETPTLEIEVVQQRDQSYFKHLPFVPVEIRCLPLAEILAEKIRACCQRNKARDIYDLGTFASKPFDRPLIRRLVVLKLWQARDAFDPELLLAKFEDVRGFDWDDLGQLVRRNQDVDHDRITVECVKGYAFLRELSPDERTLTQDRYQRERALWQRLSDECRAMIPERAS